MIEIKSLTLHLGPISAETGTASSYATRLATGRHDAEWSLPANDDAKPGQWDAYE